MRRVRGTGEAKDHVLIAIARPGFQRVRHSDLVAKIVDEDGGLVWMTPICGFTIAEFASLIRGVIFEIRNSIGASVGCGELAQKELEPSHPAFAHVAKALKGAERARTVVGQFDREFHRRRSEVR